jgi:uncharacterized protein YbjT (DUF2867 family)
MSLLVIGGTGMVGSQVVQGLLGRGVSVKAMVRSEEKSKSLPAGAEGVIGDLENTTSLPPVFEGVEKLFLLNALTQNETAQGLAAVGAAKEAGVQHVVYMTVHRLRYALHIPHFGTKAPVEDAIRESGMAFTILEPNNFYQNDLWFQDAIMSYGIYPQPIGDIGQNRVDVRDIADAAVNALLESGHDGKNYPLVGPDALTGADVAAAYTKHLGKTVRYGGNDLDAWAEQAKQMLPEWLVYDFKIMYEYFQERGLLASGDDFVWQSEVLGHEPRSFDAFVAEIVPQWKG